MSFTERQRCFECGASYPKDARTCDEDRTPLWPDTVSAVWRLEGLLNPRLGGVTCAAYHLHTAARVAIDLVRSGSGSDPAALKALAQEVQALRLLEHPNMLRLVEEGSDRSGIQYLVTDLGSARTLPDLLEESRRGSANAGKGVPLTTVSQVVRQVLGLLAAAHRLGLAHGSLSIAHVYVTSEEDSVASIGRPGAVRLHGLRALGLGSALTDAVAADLLGVAGIIFEMLTGQPPPAAGSGKAPSLPAGLEGRFAQVLMRALGVDKSVRYGSADELLRALVVAAPPSMSEVNAAALAALNRTDPQLGHSGEGAPSRPGFDAGRPLSRPPGLDTGLPAPPALHGTPMSTDLPLRSRLSGELKQVSFRDLLEQAEAPAKEETLARSRRRVSSTSIPLPAMAPPPEFANAPKRGGVPDAASGFSSGENAALEATADINVLPVDFGSSMSGKIPIASASSAGRSEISLPPQPSPVGSAQSSGVPRAGGLSPKASGPIKIAPVKPPLNLIPTRTRGDGDIDPLAETGQSVIPSDLLAVSRQMGLSAPPIAIQAGPGVVIVGGTPPPSASAIASPPVDSSPELNRPPAPPKRSIAPLAAIGGVLLLALLGLLFKLLAK